MSFNPIDELMTSDPPPLFQPSSRTAALVGSKSNDNPSMAGNNFGKNLPTDTFTVFAMGILILVFLIFILSLIFVSPSSSSCKKAKARQAKLLHLSSSSSNILKNLPSTRFDMDKYNYGDVNEKYLLFDSYDILDDLSQSSQASSSSSPKSDISVDDKLEFEPSAPPAEGDDDEDLKKK